MSRLVSAPAGNPDAPQGSQVGFLQITGSCSVPVKHAVAGVLQVSFRAAYRENDNVQVSFAAVAGYFDAAADFTVDAATATSANGAWQYGTLPDLSSPASSFGVYSLTTLTFDSVTGYEGYYAAPSGSIYPIPLLLGNRTSPPATIVDGTGSVPVGFFNKHPGDSGQYSALRFVAPAAGSYAIAGTFQGQDDAGTTTDVHILRSPR